MFRAPGNVHALIPSAKVPDETRVVLRKDAVVCLTERDGGRVGGFDSFDPNEPIPSRSGFWIIWLLGGGLVLGIVLVVAFGLDATWAVGIFLGVPAIALLWHLLTK